MNALSKPAFLAGDAEMVRRIFEFDWRTSPLGALDGWSTSLKTAIHLALATRHPEFIFWGERHICLYNDACSVLIGPEKHPDILGANAKDAWPETWDLIQPQIEMVHRGEGATWHENQLAPIIRHGAFEDAYWTYSFSPIFDPTASNDVGGVLVIFSETTLQFMREQSVDASAKAA